MRKSRQLLPGFALTLPVLTLAALTLAGLGGCGNPFWLPEAHKIEVQQGNLISQSQRHRLAAGQTKAEVLDILGQPVMETSFRSNRWDYAYARGPAGKSVETRKLTLIFDGEQVIKIEDNFDDASGEIDLKKSWWRRLVTREG